MKKWVKSFGALLGKAEEVVDTVEDVSDKVQNAVEEGERKVKETIETYTEKLNRYEQDLEMLGTIGLVEIPLGEFDELVKGTKIIQSKQTGKRESVITMYYEGPRMVAQKVRWPNAVIYFRAEYNTDIFN